VLLTSCTDHFIPRDEPQYPLNGNRRLGEPHRLSGGFEEEETLSFVLDYNYMIIWCHIWLTGIHCGLTYHSMT
jgi:hypothetical protein